MIERNAVLGGTSWAAFLTTLSVHDCFVGWIEGLREMGQNVVAYPFGDALTFYDAALLEVGSGLMRKAWTPEQAKDHAVDRMCAALYKTRPEVLLVVSGFFVPTPLLDLARWYGTRVVLLCTESPYETDRELELAEHVDVVLLNDPTHLDRFAQVAKTAYMPHAFRPAVHCPGPAVPELVCDLAFVGTGYQSRIEFFEAMDLDGLDVVLAGPWSALPPTSPLMKHLALGIDEGTDNEQNPDLYRSARVGINIYRREAQRPDLSEGWAMGPREVEQAACGLFFLRDPRGEGDQVLDMLPTFTSPGDASEQLRYWLARPDERETLARKALEAVADRTFINNAAALLRLLDKE